MWTEEICPEGAHQPTGIPSAAAVFRTFQGVDDCKLNGNTSRINLDPGLRDGLPKGFDDGIQGLEQDTDFVSLRMDWDFNENYTLTVVTGYVDLEHWELDDYSYGPGVFGGLHNNVYESFSQEVRLASHFEDSPVNFQLGLFYQEIEQKFDAFQYAFNLPVIPYFFGDIFAGGSYSDYIDSVAAATGATIVAPVNPAGGIIGPDPFTGNEYDYRKIHCLDTDVFSAFLAVYWDINERTELTIGARYTEEDKKGAVVVPYLHAGAALFGFGAPAGGRVDGLKFKDDNISPEIAINYYINDDISVFAAYKEGFKSSGLDNSALPTAALNPNSPTFNGYDFLRYESEEADGFEVGMKAHLLDGAMCLYATAFTYEYTDLQVQLFDSTIIQFQTFNASALETEGVEFTGFVGFTYETEVGGGWRFTISADARYSDDYAMKRGHP